jgi:tetratricopeptide (TPR) repeat protein
MVRASSACLVAVLASLVAPQPTTPASGGLAAAWVASVLAHEPGERDAALATVASWSEASWNEVYPYLMAVVAFANAPSQQALDRPLRSFNAVELNQLRELALEASRPRGADTFLKRGALLHTDVALFEPSSHGVTRASFRPKTGHNPGSRGLNVRVPDGRFAGLETSEWHWEFARTLVNHGLPSAGADRDVRDWYHATAALMARSYAFAEEIVHLEHAQRLFPKDARILFDLACLSEALAAPRVQESATEARSQGVVVLVDGAASNLRRAEGYLTQVTSADRTWIEPRVRLARVIFQRGRRAEAADQLRALAREDASAEVRYFALMFLGHAEEALGLSDAARRAYAQAGDLFPTAQSPKLALVNLERRQGRSAHLDPLERVLMEGLDRADRHDPWWDYFRGEGRRADVLLGELHARFRRPPS